MLLKVDKKYYFMCIATKILLRTELSYLIFYHICTLFVLLQIFLTKKVKQLYEKMETEAFFYIIKKIKTIHQKKLSIFKKKFET